METIGLIAAIPHERDALLRTIKGCQQIEMGSFHAQSFQLSGKTCILITSGMGIRRASEAARTLLEMAAPQNLISFGIAGAVEAELKIGDVIAVEAVCQLDQGIPGPFLPLTAWPEPARAAAIRALSSRGSRLLPGNAVTTAGSAVAENQLLNLLHPVLEMETAGIARVAAEKGIPFLSLRAISDGPAAPIPFNLGDILDEAANLRTGRILKAIVRHPRIIFQIRRLIHNSGIAAENAAIALIAALSHSFDCLLPKSSVYHEKIR
jgi:adenosylhomocysteine nucleosidase